MVNESKKTIKKISLSNWNKEYFGVLTKWKNVVYVMEKNL